MKLKNKTVLRGKRIAAFGIAAGLLSPGAGAWLDAAGMVQIDAVTSAIFGATLVITGLVAALLLTFAAKGEVSDEAFDQAINDAIENLNSKSKK